MQGNNNTLDIFAPSRYQSLAKIITCTPGTTRIASADQRRIAIYVTPILPIAVANPFFLFGGAGNDAIRIVFDPNVSFSLEWYTNNILTTKDIYLTGCTGIEQFSVGTITQVMAPQEEEDNAICTIQALFEKVYSPGINTLAKLNNRRSRFSNQR